MARMDGIVEVDTGENSEDVGLQEGDQEFERSQRYGQAKQEDGTNPATREARAL